MYRMSLDRDFNVNISNQIKGISIILMLVHHFFGFPQWTSSVYDTRIVIHGIDINYYIAAISKMCVSLFAFITGWSYAKNSHRDFRYSFNKAATMLKEYWKVLFFVYIPVTLLLGYKQISMTALVNSLFATSEENICFFAWYVHFYVLAIFSLPLYFYISRNSNKIKIVILGFVLIISIINHIIGLSGIVEEFFYWMPIILVGSICANSKRYAIIYQWLCKRNIIFKVSLIIFLLLCKTFRVGVGGVNFDIFYILLINLSLVSILSSNKSSFLCFMGKYSMLIWFFHGLFFSPYTKKVFQRVLFFSHNIIISFLSLYILSIGMAFIYNMIEKRVTRIKQSRKS